MPPPLVLLDSEDVTLVFALDLLAAHLVRNMNPGPLEFHQLPLRDAPGDRLNDQPSPSPDFGVAVGGGRLAQCLEGRLANTLHLHACRLAFGELLVAELSDEGGDPAPLGVARRVGPDGFRTGAKRQANDDPRECADSHLKPR